VQTVDVRTEEETEHGWRYHVFVQQAGAPPVEHIVLLSWVDHEHWSGGRFPPSRVVERLVQLLIEHGGVEHGARPLPPTFDASTARRWFPEIDREMAQSL
jgi:hypothetical protein